ncbi:MAG TPA: 30S ribosomal protein S4 [bacterium]|nr:30S ribosomal protein S4 [bacterium]HNS34234.1 30S ribosomal protein S4 [bacterium]HNZ73528.1 30S ribosomal protein S4 [bacterium]HOH67384.1 30S ribosomal protein S4 [bacterium]HQA64104.1 30S ribosomal protein S4 [bacterium]
MSAVDKQCKKCRRAGEKLFLKGEKCNSAKCPMVSRNFPPGVHGAKSFTKLTNYGRQLMEKQKAKRIYGIREKQFRNYFEKAFSRSGNTAENLFALLENRLDNVAYRLGFGASRRQARQLVSHAHLQVNGKKVDVPSYQVRVGDVVSIAASSQQSPFFVNLTETLAKKEVVPWLNLEVKTLTGKITGRPEADKVERHVDWRVIIEFYSK